MSRNMTPWEKKRTLMVKAEEKTDPRFGHVPTERPIEEYVKFGVISLDKPPGPSSHEVTAWVKRILGVTHAGHGGTLEAMKAGDTPKLLAFCPLLWKKQQGLYRLFSYREKSTSAL